MKKGKFRAIIYLISFTALLTVGIQVHRSIQNYQLNKKRFYMDVQLALDNGVEAYYSDLAKQDFAKLTEQARANGSEPTSFFSGSAWVNIDSADVVLTPPTHLFNRFDSNIVNSVMIQSSSGRTDSVIRIPTGRSTNLQFVQRNSSDTLNNLSQLASNLIISMTRDSIDFESMQTFIEEELNRVKLLIPYDLVHYRHDTVMGNLQKSESRTYALSTLTKSTFMPRGEQLEMRFENASLIILERGLKDLLISLLICVVVIGSLLYLYKIINRQKQLAEVKNDLISNITHEFKTPIATITSAIDGIVNFNTERDQAKTDKYLEISSAQLTKLNHMVEKLLETATLDSDRLMLTMEEVDVIEMLDNLSEKYQLIAKDKNVNFHTNFPSKVVEADMFHLENAISNLIDNAVKYGGNNIDIKLAENDGKMEIKVIDDGHAIEKNQRERIFEKFYRVPTGNRHDVKGFGIGLYYTRKIIEKHGGSIFLNLEANKTSFEVAI